jgi:DNA-directed RNA polymerase subunit RPC12/RpoP
MSFPVKTCVVCGEEFELKPGKPGFANRCPECSVIDEREKDANVKSKGDSELNAARRNAMRDLLYRKES